MTYLEMKRIKPPEWAHNYERRFYDGFPESVLTLIDQHRSTLLGCLQEEVENHVNDEEWVFTDGETFPDKNRLAGTYYIDHESYSIIQEKGSVIYHVSMMTQCLEHPWKDKKGEDVEDLDYLGLEINFIFDVKTNRFSFYDKNYSVS